MIRDAVYVSLGLLAPLISASSNARADFSLGLVAMDTMSTPKASEPATSYTFDAKPSIGGGLLAQFSIVGSFGLQLGAIFGQRKYSATVTSTSTGVTTVAGNIFEIPVLELPLIVTFSPTSWLSFGAGAYYGVVIDHVGVSDSSGGGGIDQSLANTQLNDKDYGLTAELRLLVPFFSIGSGHGSLWLEGQYLYGLANSAVEPGGGSSPNSFYYRDFQIVGGFAVGWH